MLLVDISITRGGGGMYSNTGIQCTAMIEHWAVLSIVKYHTDVVKCSAYGIQIGHDFLKIIFKNHFQNLSVLINHFLLFATITQSLDGRIRNDFELLLNGL
jgi:hypothetical protein